MESLEPSSEPEIHPRKIRVFAFIWRNVQSGLDSRLGPTCSPPERIGQFLAVYDEGLLSSRFMDSCYTIINLRSGPKDYQSGPSHDPLHPQKTKI
jgi:hypothetical protein